MTRKQRPIRGLPKWRLLLPLTLILLLLVILYGVRAAAAVARVQDDLQSVLAVTQDASPALVQPEQASELQAQLEQSAQDIRGLRASLGPLVNLAPWLNWIPRYGGELANAPALLEFSEKTVTGAEMSARVGQTFAQALAAQEVSQGSPGAVLAKLVDAQSEQIRQARAAVAETAQARERIDATQLSPSRQALLNRLDRWLPPWQLALDGLSLAPELLGDDHAHTFLLILQNSDELRATGGFVSAVALLRVERGTFRLSDFRDSYAVDDLDKAHPAPPTPLYLYMQAPQWMFRDANWSPDPPTAARALESIYQLDRGTVTDGVIVTNLNLLPRLLQALGPVRLDGYDETVDAANVRDKLQAYWDSPNGEGQTGDWWIRRKDFTGKLLDAVFMRLQAGDFKTVELGRALLDAVTAKELLVYANDVSEKNALSGAISQAPGDALMIVDSNVGFNKVDGKVERSAEYDVDLYPSGVAAATLTLTYTNHSPVVQSLCVHVPHYIGSYAELQEGCYWDYVRIVTPSRVQLLHSTSGIDAGVEEPLDNRSILNGYILVSRGETRRIEFRYQMPDVVADGSTYRLRIEKQPGAPTRLLKVRLTLPEDWDGYVANPLPQKAAGRDLEYDLQIDRDLELAVIRRTAAPNLLLALGAGGAVVIAAGLVGWRWSRRRTRELDTARM